MEMSIYDGCGIIHPKFIKRQMVMYLKESAFCVVEESENNTECTKNRYGNRTMQACSELEFEMIKLSELSGTMVEICRKYYGKNVWLLMEQ